jgi:hypothetical protein
MLVFLTVCTARQLPAVLALFDSIRQTHPNTELIIGLADTVPPKTGGLPARAHLWPIADLWPAEDLARRSAQYTPTELTAATKPTFIRAVYERFTDCDTVVYVDPATFFYHPITNELARHPHANLLLTPHLSRPPDDGLMPDEKHVQNVGLYTAGMIVFRRSDTTARFLAWWEGRVADRAFINFCDGLCLDQIWLMYAPAFLVGVAIVTTPGWNAGLWNLHESRLIREIDSNQWLVNGISPLVSVNFCGLTNANEGLFPYQTRFDKTARADVQQLIADYRERTIMRTDQLPAYGQRPEPPVLRGWRKTATDQLHNLTRQIETAPVPDGFTALTDRLRGLSGS